ncbi:MAG: DUF3160 domain-containing protein [Coriobacteriia bacterium]|nr:DUF3160 domain-containing protein [Coriobacteriia bacterium]
MTQRRTSDSIPSDGVRALSRRAFVAAAGAVAAVAAGGAFARPAHADGWFSFFTGGASSDTSATADIAPADAPVQRPLFLDGLPEELESQVPSVPDMPWADDLGNVINIGDAYQADAALASLRERGFYEILGSGGYEFFELYEINRYNLMPNFVTVDSMVHTYHLYFAYLLKKVERDHLATALLDLSMRMFDESLTQLQVLAGSEWEAAARLNTGFFAVGTALLDPMTGAFSQLDAETQGMASEELRLVTDAAGIAPSPLFEGAEEDYTQYAPRGYYAESEALSSYFRAMMWYGRRNFTQSSELLGRAALLMTMALAQLGTTNGLPAAMGIVGPDGSAVDSGAAAVSPDAAWASIYQVTSFFAGASDDAGFYEYIPLVRSAFGADASPTSLPGNDAGWKAFSDLAAQLPAPQINSIPMLDDEEDVDRLDENKGFRFMGQRFTLDASIFQQLIYDRVKEREDGAQRLLPDVLDVPAALGSQAAYDVLAGQGDTTYPNYDEQLTKVREGIAAAPDSLWKASLYAQWLNMLRPLLDVKGAGWPNAMQGEAWARRSLKTFGGSFAELKHDTVLYAKQVMAEAGGVVIDPRDDRGYVEPEPAVFGRLGSLVQATSAGLSLYGMPDQADLDNLSILQQLAEQLRVIANKELRAELPTEDEFELIRSFGVQLEHFWQAVHEEDAGGVEFTTTEFPAAIVTDIATDPNGAVLEIGTGTIANLTVIVPVDGTLRLASGPAYSFYQFAQPIDQRLTDSTWREMIGVQVNDYTTFDWDAAQQRAADVVPWVKDFAFSAQDLW